VNAFAGVRAQALERRSIDITEIAKQVAATLRPRAGAPDEISIAKHARGGRSELLSGARAIENLVGNALEAHLETGKPRVEDRGAARRSPPTFFLRRPRRRAAIMSLCRQALRPTLPEAALQRRDYPEQAWSWVSYSSIMRPA